MTINKKHYVLYPSGEVFVTRHPEHHEAELLPTKKGEAMYKEQITKSLCKHLFGNQVVYVSCISVSATGMSRKLKLYIVKDDRIVNITYHAAIVTGSKYNDKDATITINGCGMDMGFAMVSNLSYALYVDENILKHEWL